jgi:hypothetical protein
MASATAATRNQGMRACTFVRVVRTGSRSRSDHGGWQKSHRGKPMRPSPLGFGVVALVGLLLAPNSGFAEPHAVLDLDGVESLVTTCRGAAGRCQPITFWAGRATSRGRPGWVSYRPVGDQAFCEHFRAVLARRGRASSARVRCTSAAGPPRQTRTRRVDPTSDAVKSARYRPADWEALRR